MQLNENKLYYAAPDVKYTTTAHELPDLDFVIKKVLIIFGCNL